MEQRIFTLWGIIKRKSIGESVWLNQTCHAFTLEKTQPTQIVDNLPEREKYFLSASSM